MHFNVDESVAFLHASTVDIMTAMPSEADCSPCPSGEAERAHSSLAHGVPKLSL